MMGHGRVTWRGEAAKRVVAAGVEDGLRLGAEHLLEESRRIVPIEESTLEASGFADVDGTEASVSYDTPYAVVQHEDLSLAHDAGRDAKYLENPALDEADVIARLIAREVKAAIEGGLL